MPRILGVDSSLTSTGLCRVDVKGVWHDPGTPQATEHTMLTATLKAPGPKTKTRREYSRRIDHVVRQVEAALEDVDLIVMEELAYGAKGDTAFVLAWLWGRIIDLAEKHDIPLIFANVSQLKKYGTGKGNAGKDEVIARMVRAYPEIEIRNNNEADAVVLALIGCRRLGYPIDHLTQAKAEVMAKIGETAP